VGVNTRRFTVSGLLIAERQMPSPKVRFKLQRNEGLLRVELFDGDQTFTLSLGLSLYDQVCACASTGIYSALAVHNLLLFDRRPNKQPQPLFSIVFVVHFKCSTGKCGPVLIA
jgi:hypothetical protein